MLHISRELFTLERRGLGEETVIAQHFIHKLPDEPFNKYLNTHESFKGISTIPASNFPSVRH